MLVKSRDLQSHSKCILDAKSGKYQKRFTLQTSNYDVIVDFSAEFPVNIVSMATSFKKCNVMMT